MSQFATSDNQIAQPVKPASNAPSDLFVQAHADDNRTILDSAVHTAVGLVWHDEKSKARKVVEEGVEQFATAAPLFMGGARGYVLSGLMSGLNQAKLGESAPMFAADFGLGMVKGAATKGTFEYFGNNEKLNFAAKGMLMGSSSRVIDNVLDRQTYINAKGQTDILGGLEKTGAAALNPIALATDVAVFGTAHYGFKWADKALEGKLAKSPMAATIFTGSTFGFTSGALGEIQQEHQKQQGYHPLDILAKAGEQSLVMGAASAAGLKMSAKLPHVVRVDSSERTAWNDTTERASSLKNTLQEKLVDAKNLLSGNRGGLMSGQGDIEGTDGEVHSAEVQPAPAKQNTGEAAVEPAAVLADAVEHNVAPVVNPDLAAQLNAAESGERNPSVDAALNGGDQTHTVSDATPNATDTSRATENSASSDSHEFEVPKDRKADFDEGVKLFLAVLEKGGSPQDLQNFFDWTRGPGQDLQPYIKQVGEAYGTELSRELANGAWLPNFDVSVVGGYQDIAVTAQRLLQNLAVENPSQQDIEAFLDFARTPEAYNHAADFRPIAEKIAETSGVTDVLERFDRAFPAQGETVQADYDGPPQYEGAYQEGFKLVSKLARDPSNVEAAEALKALGKGDGKFVEQQLIELAERVGGPKLAEEVETYVFHPDDQRMWVNGPQLADLEKNIWVGRDNFEQADHLRTLAETAVQPGMDADLAARTLNDFAEAAKEASPEVRNAILEYAEKSGSPALLATVRDVFAPPKASVEIPLSREQYDRFQEFEAIIQHRPVSDSDVQQYQEAIWHWLNANGDLHRAVLDAAPGMSSSAEVAAIDAYFKTNFQLGFPTSDFARSEFHRYLRRSGYDVDAAANTSTNSRSEVAQGVPSGKIMEMSTDDLLRTMYNSPDLLTQERAGQAAQLRISDMNVEQFGQYLQYLYTSSPVSDGKGGTVGRWNMDLIHLPGSSVLHRADLVEKLSGEDSAKWIAALHQFMSFTPSGAPEFPSFVANADPADLSNWLLSDINRRYILNPQPVDNPSINHISADLQRRVAEDVQNQDARQKEMAAAGKLRGRPKGPPEAIRPETSVQRLATLDSLLNSGLPPEAMMKLMEIGGQDGRLLGDVLKKIDLYKAAPEFRRAVELTLPHADNLYTFNVLIRSLEDATNLAYKNADAAQKAAKLAKSAAETMLTPGSAAEQELVSGDGTGMSLIDKFGLGQVRLPRPPRDNKFGDKGGGKPGDKGGKFGREQAPPPPVTWNFSSGGDEAAPASVAAPNDQAGAQAEHHADAPEAAESGAPRDPDNMIDLMRKHGALTEEQLETAQAIANQMHTPLSQAMVDVGLFEPDYVQQWKDYAQNVLDNGGVEPAVEQQATASGEPETTHQEPVVEQHEGGTPPAVTANVGEVNEALAEGVPDQQVAQPVIEPGESSAEGGAAPVVAESHVADPDLSAIRFESVTPVPAPSASESSPVEEGDGANNRPVEQAVELPTFNSIDQAMLDAVLRGSGDAAAIRDFIQDGREARKAGRDPIHIKQRAVSDELAVLKKKGWIEQKPNSHEVQVTEKYRELLKQRQAAAKK